MRASPAPAGAGAPSPTGEGRDVVEALQSARRLALLTRDAARLEAEAPRHKYHHWRAAVQAEARHLERLTAALGIKETEQGGEDG